jgi:predicted phage tail protein
MLDSNTVKKLQSMGRYEIIVGAVLFGWAAYDLGQWSGAVFLLGLCVTMILSQLGNIAVVLGEIHTALTDKSDDD